MDPNNVEALTPNHLMLLRSNPSLPPGLFQEVDLCTSLMEASPVYGVSVLEAMAKRILTMAKQNFGQGDVVLLVDRSVHRNSWVIGRIIQAVLDEHGLVRKVKVKTTNGEFI